MTTDPDSPDPTQDTPGPTTEPGRRKGIPMLYLITDHKPPFVVDARDISTGVVWQRKGQSK